MITEKHRWLLGHVNHRGEDCLTWPFSLATPGYGQLMVRRKLWMAHRLMCILAHGEPPTSKHHAAHSCGNRSCVNPNHIGWKTASSNQIDRRKHGTKSVGWKGKLTPKQVLEIRLLKGRETSVQTAKRYGVTESNVRLVQSGIAWKNI